MSHTPITGVPTTETAESQSVQQQIAEARRSRILKAAITVFAQKGFPRATIKDIAKVAGIADGTLYNYFENKDALLLALLEELNESSTRADYFRNIKAGTPEDFFRQYIHHRLQVMGGENLQLLQVLLSEILINADLRTRYYQQVLKPTTDLARQAMTAQGKHDPQSLESLLRLIPGMTLGLLMMRMLGDPYVDTHWEELIDETVDMFLPRLFPPEEVTEARKAQDARTTAQDHQTGEGTHE